VYKWRPEFNRVAAIPKSYSHPASTLNEMLNMVYGRQTNEPWQSYLRTIEPDLRTILADAKRRPEFEMSSSEGRAWALLNILMGRIYIRLSRGQSTADYLMKALEHFDAVDIKRYQPGSDVSRYQSAVSNGRGTVYANAFTVMLPPTRVDVSQICRNAAECANAALKAYVAAGEISEPCTFEYIRRINNTADLLVRIGSRYGEIRQLPFERPIHKWVQSPTALADQLEAQVTQMLNCHDSGPFIPNTFLTAAESFGVCASLRRMAGDKNGEVRNKLAAGTYFRIAHSFDKKNFPCWDLSYFSFALNNGEIDKDFKEAVTSRLDGLPQVELDDVIARLRWPRKCQ
jgi:hypothetical protein